MSLAGIPLRLVPRLAILRAVLGGQPPQTPAAQASTLTPQVHP
jgi:hypothetical protein